jgi:hypothetical protein
MEIRGHRFVPVAQVFALIGANVSAVFALIHKIVRYVRFLRKEIAGRVVGDLRVDAFSMTIFAAQDPFRLVCHSA